ncbi:MAG: HIT domain-containing protein [Acidobacteria bacterium]|nr:HIT domain-containing protein [Acidobacteriota bacterium]
MERLWSPWRLPYVSAGEPQGCIFCEAQQSGDGSNASLIVFDGTHCFVILNLFPYNSGHLMIVPRRHVASLASASSDELGELIDLTRRAELALMEAYSPHGLNIGINLGRPAGAGIVDHLHLHIVPRWNGDTSFMSVIGHVRVLPEELPQTVEKLRPIFARLARETTSRRPCP